MSTPQLSPLTFAKRNLLQQGFSLVEVLIAMTLSTIALLGLAIGQLKALQYATNSFNYTVSIIQASNAIERTWIDLCDLQSATIDYNNDFFDKVAPQFGNYNMVLTPDPLSGGVFANEMSITVRWTDSRMNDALANQVQLFASFPNIC